MGLTRKPAPVRLVMGFLASDAEAIEALRPQLREKFGEEELYLPAFPFAFTNYYESEIGSAPVRAFTTYETLIEREEIVNIKLWTNELELRLANEKGTPGLRPVNLDPGYMSLGQFFLATTKDQRQRVYIRDGIFVEPTLYFQEGHFHPFAWTYHDYQSPEYIKYLEEVRRRLAHQHTTGKPYNQRRKMSETPPRNEQE